MCVSWLGMASKSKPNELGAIDFRSTDLGELLTVPQSAKEWVVLPMQNKRMLPANAGMRDAIGNLPCTWSQFPANAGIGPSSRLGLFI